MKLTSLLSPLLILSLLLAFASCSDDDIAPEDDYPYEFIEGGEEFLLGNAVRFYYIDGEGKDLIDLADLSTLPVSYNLDEKLPTEHLVITDYKELGGELAGGLYNRNHNTVVYDEDEKLFYMQTSLYGDMSKPNYVFYIGFGGEFDKMDMTYRYTDKNVIGSKYHAKVISWKFNGVHVYSDDDQQDKKVFVTKADGKTSVSWKR